MIKVYIVGPTTGYIYNNKRAFRYAEDVLYHAGVEPLNPATIEIREGEDWLDYIRTATRLLTTADEILLLRGWEDDKSAVILHDWAEKCGLEMRSLGWWEVEADGRDRDFREAQSAHASGGAL